MAGPDGAEGDIVRPHHADRRLDRVDVPPEGRRVGCRAGDRAMMDVVDRERPQREHLRQPSPNLVDEEHDAEGLIAVEPRLPPRRQRDGVKVVVPELPGRPPLGRVVAEVRAVGIPLPHRRCIGRHPLLDRHRSACSEADRPPAPRRGRGCQRLATQHRRRVCPQGECRHAAADAVDVEPLEERERRAPHRLRATEELDRVVGESPGLVRRRGEEAGGAGAGGPRRGGMTHGCVEFEDGTPARQKEPVRQL